MTATIRCAGVTKRFGDRAEGSTWKDALLGRRRAVPGVDALRGVDLEVEPGSAVGVVGANGAGKSTLLRIIGGVLVADGGTVEVRGRLGSLLELGAGFHPDLTGRESAVLAGVVAGLSRKAARESVEGVCDFAELERFIDRPLRTYSSGMQARLAFAIATARRPDVLLVDEVLAVGDVAFQQRCVERIRRFQASGTSIVLVSHDPGLVRLVCDRAVWLDAGRVVEEGVAGDVIDAYLGGGGTERPVLSTGALGAVRVLDLAGGPTPVLQVGSGVVVEVGLGDAVAEGSRLAVRLVRSDGLVCIDTSTDLEGGGGAASLRLERLDLAPGEYRVEVGIYDRSWHEALDFRHDAARLRVLGTASATAALAPPATWRVEPGGEGRGRRQG